MGYPKMLLKFNGLTMLETVIKNVKDSEIDNILVVLGANIDKLSGIVKNSEVSYCYNENYSEGMLSSVKCGFRHLPPGSDAVMVFQGDQPLIKPGVINSLIREFRGSDKGIVIPVYKGRRGHPLLIDKRYFESINHLDANEGLRSLSNIYSGDVLEVESTDEGIMRDFDTYDDYKNEINLNR